MTRYFTVGHAVASIALAMLLSFATNAPAIIVAGVSSPPDERHLSQNTGQLIPAEPGERWGGFVFYDDPTFQVPSEERVPPLRSLRPEDNPANFPQGSPGYREFRSVEELATFLGPRGPVLRPAVPPAARLLGAYTVVAEDGWALTTALSYAIGDSKATIGDPDLWVSYSSWIGQPVAYSTRAGDRGLGRRALPPQKLTIEGRQAVYLGVANPDNIAPDLRLRAAISWFEADGGHWTVQTRSLDFAAHLDVAKSLLSFAIGAQLVPNGGWREGVNAAAWLSAGGPTVPIGAVLRTADTATGGRTVLAIWLLDAGQWWYFLPSYKGASTMMGVPSTASLMLVLR